jgi:hypothetical protein
MAKKKSAETDSPVRASIFIAKKLATAILKQHKVLVKHFETNGCIIKNILSED